LCFRSAWLPALDLKALKVHKARKVSQARKAKQDPH
jgi:hypothetical protein